MDLSLRRQARLLLVDDEPANLRYLEIVLQQEGYSHIYTTTDPRQVLALYQSIQPDLIVLDLMMPYLDGFAVLDQLRALLPPEVYLPILVLTADPSPEVKRRALARGARDFLTKPFDPLEVTLRLGNLLDVRLMHRRLVDHNAQLEHLVRERTAALDQAHEEVLLRLARAAEFRDDATGEHTQRVGRLAAAMAARLGRPAAEAALLGQAAPLHDVGKIAIPDAILLKPGLLTPDEFALIQTHATIGARLLAGGASGLIMLAQEIALTHHERWDGSGYPVGLAGPAIPLAGRIVAVADVYDALTHARPYKPAWPPAAALVELQRQRDRQFDAAVGDALLAALDGSDLEAVA